MESPFQFQVRYEDASSRGRLGRLTTPHGTLETPSFIFCATKAAIKGLTIQQVQEAGTAIILSNTYHLMLQPGEEVVAQFGGLHRFMGWPGPMLTDSGGFQIFSLGHGSVAAEIKGTRNTGRPQNLLRITEEGATFKSYLDGRRHLLTPERSIQIQHKLGADLIVVLDECTPFHVDKAYTEASMGLSHRWAHRSLAEFHRLEASTHQALYGIIQGGVYPDLRRVSADFVNSHPFFGHAIGGSLGASKAQMGEVVEMTMETLDRSRPVHLLGIGGISDIFMGVAQGIDTFDCVHPTRLARHGGALIQPHYWETATESPHHSREHINLYKACFRHDPQPLDARCPCATCRIYSRGYLHHLFKAGELLGITALTLHNVTTMNRLLAEIRAGLESDNLEAVKKRWLSASSN